MSKYRLNMTIINPKTQKVVLNKGDIISGNVTSDGLEIDKIVKTSTTTTIESYLEDCATCGDLIFLDDVVKEKPKAKLIGENGNIYNLMGIAKAALQKAGMADEAKEMITKITTTAKSYGEALVILGEYVDIR